VVDSWGNGKLIVRWPSTQKAELSKATGGKDLGRYYPVSEVRRLTVAKHPALAEWDSSRLSWADLQYLEGKAMITAMVTLMNDSIPSLPVHDSLLVPSRQRAQGVKSLGDAFETVCGLRPYLVVNHGG
jgi:hypothetical protein